MKNNEHKLVQDLFPSYIDGLTTSETNAYIEEHLANCGECQKVLENMKTKIQEENHTDLNDAKVRYAKKVNKRLRILKILILIIILAIIVFFADFYRKLMILKKLDQLGNQYLNENNYIITKIGNADAGWEIGYLMREYVKGDKSLKVGTTFIFNSVDRDLFPVVYSTKTYIDGYDYHLLTYDSAGNMEDYRKTGDGGNVPQIETFSTLKEKNFYDGLFYENRFKTAAISKIKTVTFDGVECYSIEFQNPDNHKLTNTVYFEKETGLLRKMGNEEYYYQFNMVNDKALELPEIPEKFLEDVEE
ncbi:MAG: zf-HC2 domain-containing protein [Clostridia bacterium]|nr:zf-HC2 domain-containing protein [Clostridia bacterium]